MYQRGQAVSEYVIMLFLVILLIALGAFMAFDTNVSGVVSGVSSTISQ